MYAAAVIRGMAHNRGAGATSCSSSSSSRVSKTSAWMMAPSHMDIMLLPQQQQ
jgi:hypothetical protein